MSEPASVCTQAREEVELLQHCPACDYRLEGLPAAYACPECGLSFDRRWTVFGGRRGVFVRSTRTLAVAGAICFFVLGGLCLGLTGFSSGGRSMMWDGLSSGLMFLSMLPAVWRRGSFFLAVGPRGICVYQGQGQVDYWEWSHVLSSREQLARGDLRIETGARPFRLNAWPNFTRRTPLAQMCCEEILKQMDACNGDEPEADNAGCPIPS